MLHQLLGSWCQITAGKFGWVQQRATRVTGGLFYTMYKEKPRQQGLFLALKGESSARTFSTKWFYNSGAGEELSNEVNHFSLFPFAESHQVLAQLLDTLLVIGTKLTENPSVRMRLVEVACKVRQLRSKALLLNIHFGIQSLLGEILRY